MNRNYIASELVKAAKEVTAATTISRGEMNEFVEYVMSFYNDRDGLYPIIGLTERDVVKAINTLLKNRRFEWGGGDSVDRERVRDILTDKMGYKIAKEMTAKDPQRYFTLHENGKWSLIDQGLPVNTPRDLNTVKSLAKREGWKIDQVWVAETGKFIPLNKAQKMAGCEKLPAGGMRENCEKKSKGGDKKDDSKSDDKDDKKDKKDGKGKMPAELLEKFKKKADCGCDHDDDEDDD